MSRAPLSRVGSRSSGRKAYTRVTPQSAPSDLPHITKIVTTTASRFDIMALDWNYNNILLGRMQNLKENVDDVNTRLDITILESKLRSISALSLGNLSTTSVAPTVAPMQSVQIFTSPSGLNFIQANAIANDIMDTTMDFFIPPPRIPSPLDTIMSDPDPDPTASPVPIALSTQSKKNIIKAEKRLRLKPPQTALGYRQCQRKAVKELGGIVPVFYFLTLGNRNLTLIIGYVRGDGWTLSSTIWETEEELSKWRWPSDASQLVTDCFTQVVLQHNLKLYRAVDAGQELKNINKLYRMIEPCSSSPLSFKTFVNYFDVRLYRHASWWTFPRGNWAHPGQAESLQAHRTICYSIGVEWFTFLQNISDIVQPQRRTCN